MKGLVFDQNNSMREKSRTAALCLQYMEMIDVLRTFIKAERTGNWELHLKVLALMLPYLAASGHDLYVKCVRLYLQSMNRLETEHPDVYRSFLSVLHVVRRCDRLWAGLSTDLVIEQVSSGLTRSRGMTEQQRLTWLLALPACAETNRAMQEMTDVLQYNSGEQNKDMTNARKQRDILTVLAERNPFASNPGLRNIMSGINAHSTVNVDTAKDTGKKILTSMTGQSATDYTFKRNAQAVTLVATSAVKIDNDLVQIDPQLLFQRLILACEGPDELAAVFRYELCSYPPALFDPSLMMRQPQKPVLADAIWAKLTPDAKTEPSSGAQYVLDGGALLHRVIWPQGSVTYKEICLLYCRYVSRKYGTPIIVFDGYEEESTKSMTQQRRANGKVGANVNFTAEMKVAMKKDLFLSNAKNKQQFIEMLATFLRNIDCQTHQAKGDADVLIVKTAVESASEKTTILVGDDTDLLVLLLYYTPSNSCDLFFKPEPKANSTKRRVWNIKKVQTQIGEDICWNILFIHAILGCDTTSRVHGFG